MIARSSAAIEGMPPVGLLLAGRVGVWEMPVIGLYLRTLGVIELSGLVAIRVPALSLGS